VKPEGITAEFAKGFLKGDRSEAGAQAIQADRHQDGGLSATACFVWSRGTPLAIQWLQIEPKLRSGYG
jgi:hypothetical protein